MSKSLKKKQKVESDIPNQTMSNLDVRRMIAYNLSFKDQVRLNRVTKFFNNRISNHQKTLNNEIYHVCKTLRLNLKIESMNNLKIFNVMDGREFATKGEANSWAIEYMVPKKLPTYSNGNDSIYNITSYRINHDGYSGYGFSGWGFNVDDYS